MALGRLVTVADLVVKVADSTTLRPPSRISLSLLQTSTDPNGGLEFSGPTVLALT